MKLFFVIIIGSQFLLGCYNSNSKSSINFKSNDTSWLVNYFSNGKIKDSSYRVNGVGDFIIKSWNENGQLIQSFGFKNSNYNGTSLTFYDNGLIKDSAFFVSGKREGICKKWYENGKLKFIDNYKNGKLEGQQILFYENGELQTKAWFKNDTLLNTEEQDNK